MVRRIEKIETALEPRFQEHFVSAMAIPNKIDAFPELSKVVTFPAPKVFEAGEDGGRREAAARRRRTHVRPARPVLMLRADRLRSASRSTA